MIRFVVQVPTSELHRLEMFSRDSLRVVPDSAIVSLRPQRSVVLVDARFGMMMKLSRMFPDWHFQALLG